MNTVILYHSIDGHLHCDDGFGAALAAYFHFGDRAHYEPFSYNPDEDRMKELLGLCLNKDVYMLDVSLDKTSDRPQTKRLLEVAKSYTLIDHHKTAFEAHNGQPYFVYDGAHSGAMLAFNHFHSPSGVDYDPDSNKWSDRTGLLKLMSYIEDGDLFRYSLPNSKVIQSWLRSFSQDFETWIMCASRLNCKDPFVQAVEVGTSIRRKHDKDVDLLFALKHRYLLETPNKQHADGVSRDHHYIDFEIVNCNKMFASDLGSKLAALHGVGMTYFVRADKMVEVSLRSIRGSNYNVRLIAESFKGGGHDNAAGFSMTWDEFTKGLV